MKSILLIFFFLSAYVTFANSIDSIANDNDVFKFLTRIDKQFTKDKYPPLQILSTDSIRKVLQCDGIFNKWNIRNWEKTDFNRDGKTDLFVILQWYTLECYVAIDKGNNLFQLVRLSRYRINDCEIGKPFHVYNQQALLFYSKTKEFTLENNLISTKQINQIDTLIFKFDGFIELNINPDYSGIDSIIFKTSSSWSPPSDIFVVKLLSDLKSEVKSYQRNSNKLLRKQTIDEKTTKCFTDLIGYIDLRKLKDKYSVPRTDAATIYLKIIFKNGSSKEIEDYGMVGTYGLLQLYKSLFTATNFRF